MIWEREYAGSAINMKVDGMWGDHQKCVMYFAGDEGGSLVTKIGAGARVAQAAVDIASQAQWWR